MTARIADVERELAALAELDRTALVDRWCGAFGPDAPPPRSRALIAKAIAYDVQVKAFGGLSARTRRSLRAAAKAEGSSALSKLPSGGTRLVREWNGALHALWCMTRGGLLWRAPAFL